MSIPVGVRRRKGIGKDDAVRKRENGRKDKKVCKRGSLRKMRFLKE